MSPEFSSSKWHSLRGWHLVHDYPEPEEKGFMPHPLTSLPSLGRKAAIAAMEEIGRYNDSQKFIAPEDYLEKRGEVEEWLLKEFKELHQYRPHNVVEARTSPLYFKVVRHWSGSPTKGYNRVGIPAHLLPSEYMSFTIGDSFFHYAMAMGKSYDNTPQGLRPRLLASYDLWPRVACETELEPFLEDTHEAHEQGRYIECQFWGDDPLISLLGNHCLERYGYWGKEPPA